MEKPACEGGIPVRSTPIYYGHQYIDEDDIKAVTDVLRSDYLTCGPKIGELENKLCSITGAKYAVVCSNGTAALHIACMAAGVSGGDEVITTPITFAASANCALYCGAKPVFADIDPENYNIDPDRVKDLVTEKTKAVVAVDFTGQSVRLDELLCICHEKGITLIEDGAHVIGTKYKNKMNGSIADMTTLSFHPVKTVTGGEGGAVLTNDEALYKKLLLYRSHGITRDTSLMEKEPDGPWYYEMVDLGYNYRMTDMQAALIISQLDKLQMFSDRRKEIVKKYIFNDPTDTYHRREVVDKIYKLLNDVYDGKTSFHSFAWDMRGIVQSEVENAGHWYEDGDSIYKQFRQEFRTQDGNKTRMVTIYIADDIYKTIAEKYGGRAQFRNAMFGKMNITSDSTRGAMGLDAFYDSLVQGNYGLEETTALCGRRA